MQGTPKSMKLHIGIFGKRNAGKSTLINIMANQEVSIVSDVAGTTTDAVEKSMELLPIGPVVLIDTAGLDDEGVLGQLRVDKSRAVVDRIDFAIIVSDYKGWDDYEVNLFNDLKSRNIPVAAIVNKVDEYPISIKKHTYIKTFVKEPLLISLQHDKNIIDKVKHLLIENMRDDLVSSPVIVGDVIERNDLAVLVVPIDSSAPKGRIILPQVQTIRDILDNDAMALVVKEDELENALAKLNTKPAIVITDSQAFKTVNEIVPQDVRLTSFSILFARLKGDLKEFVKGVFAINRLREGDKVLVFESCTHHQGDEDIAKVKIPNLIRESIGFDVQFEYLSGHSVIRNIQDYALIIHCGGCMTNRREILSRILNAQAHNVPITNYGLTIAYCLGILDRALEPFRNVIE